MKPLFCIAIFMSCVTSTTIGQTHAVAGSTNMTMRAVNPPLDSNVLVVINGKVAGSIKEIKNDINSLMPAEIIESINVIKGAAATEKYGEKGRYGVLEIILKQANKKADSIIDTSDKPLHTEEKIFERVDIEASFPGGDALWRKYLEQNLNASTPANNRAPEGAYTVVVQFIVDKDGTISDVRALTNHGYGMEAEVVRVIKRGPKWTPAIQDGSPVKAYRKQPVTFMVMSDKKMKKNRNQD